MQKHLWKTAAVAAVLMMSVLVLMALAQEKKRDPAPVGKTTGQMMPGCAMHGGEEEGMDAGGPGCCKSGDMKDGKKGCGQHGDMKACGMKGGSKGCCMHGDMKACGMKSGSKGCGQHADMKACGMKSGSKGCGMHGDMKACSMKGEGRGCGAQADVKGRCVPGGEGKGMEDGSREGEVGPD